MKASRIPLIVLSLAAAPVYASDVDLSLTNDSVKGQVNFFGTNSDIQVGTGYTYHEGSRHIGNVDFHAQGRTAIGNLPTTAGIGVRAFGWDDDRLDGGAVALGEHGPGPQGRRPLRGPDVVMACILRSSRRARRRRGAMEIEVRRVSRHDRAGAPEAVPA